MPQMKSDSELIDALGGTAAVARLVNVRPPSVHEWRSRGIPGDKIMLLGADIERVTHGEVRRWDLRPLDWHRIWPELKGTDGAPTPPDTGHAPLDEIEPGAPAREAA
jgi:DNA-binding transcriptional regulator YdaS (Cro superfamily)